ncbi:MAG: nitronate monooxygenase [Clostridiales bacterium]|jgi:enoyl-[acyl-carrier protein] reductase II|nr:nitronate monooxygenase [Clostridiales bacterium]
MLKTALCHLLGIDHPIIQGGMAWVSDARLASAVSNAGGLGIIAAGNASPEYVENQIRLARTLTDKPFGVNVMLMSPQSDEVAKIISAQRVPVVTTGAGSPAPYMASWLENGIKVIPVIPSVAISMRMERLGATAVIAEGGESGGHVGELSTMALLPQVCSAVKIQVVAAGGIGDGRGLAAALMLGATGVQLGTRFICAKECGVHQNYKDKIIKASDTSTITTGKTIGLVRSLKTPFSRRFSRLESDGVSKEELESLGAGALRLAATIGDKDNGCFMAGQIAGLVDKEQTSLEIIEELLLEAEALLSSAGKWLEQ